MFCNFFSDPENATISLAPFLLSLSSWSNEIQIVQSPLQSFSPKLIWLCHLEASTLWCADILQHPAPLGAAKETFDSPISISTGDAISSSTYQVFRVCFLHFFTSFRGKGIKDLTDCVLPGVTWCWVCQHCCTSVNKKHRYSPRFFCCGMQKAAIYMGFRAILKRYW